MMMMVVMMFVMVTMMMMFGGSRDRRKSESRDQHSCCNERFQHGRFLFFPQKCLWVSHYRPARVNAN